MTNARGIVKAFLLTHADFDAKVKPEARRLLALAAEQGLLTTFNTVQNGLYQMRARRGQEDQVDLSLLWPVQDAMEQELGFRPSPVQTLQRLVTFYLKGVGR